MRTLLALLIVTTACGDKPTAPDPKQFAAMSEDAKCAATLPRAKKCVDELIAQQFESVMDPGSEADKKVAAAMATEIREEKYFSDEAEALHRTNCAASETYPDSVVACWAQADCKAFATCVMKAEEATVRKHRKPEPAQEAPMVLPD